MTDTTEEIKQLVREQIMARSSAERFVMGAEMFDSALAVVKAVVARESLQQRIQTATLQTSLPTGAARLAGGIRRGQATLMYRR